MGNVGSSGLNVTYTDSFLNTYDYNIIMNRPCTRLYKQQNCPCLECCKAEHCFRGVDSTRRRYAKHKSFPSQDKLML